MWPPTVSCHVRDSVPTVEVKASSLVQVAAFAIPPAPARPFWFWKRDRTAWVFGPKFPSALSWATPLAFMNALPLPIRKPFSFCCISLTAIPFKRFPGPTIGWVLPMAAASGLPPPAGPTCSSIPLPPLEARVPPPGAALSSLVHVAASTTPEGTGIAIVVCWKFLTAVSMGAPKTASTLSNGAPAAAFSFSWASPTAALLSFRCSTGWACGALSAALTALSIAGHVFLPTFPSGTAIPITFF